MLVRLKLEIAIVSNQSGQIMKDLEVRLKLEIAIVSNGVDESFTKTFRET